MPWLISAFSLTSNLLSFRHGGALALLAAGLMLAGCSSEYNGPPRVPLSPVSGQVKIEGETPDGAYVVFHSVTKTTPTANATTDAQGNFKLSTYDSGDGAAPGEYLVTVELRKLVKQEGGGWAPGPNLVSDKFASPATTPLKVTVAASPNTIPLEVKK